MANTPRAADESKALCLIILATDLEILGNEPLAAPC